MGNKENSPVRLLDKSVDGVGKKRSAALEDQENYCNLLNVKRVEPVNHGLCSPSRKVGSPTTAPKLRKCGMRNDQEGLCTGLN